MDVNNNDYFAARSASDVISELEERFADGPIKSGQNGLDRKRRRSYNFYYGKHFLKNDSLSGGEIQDAGEDGELKVYAVNHYRNIIKHILILSTNQRPTFDVQAVNTDPESISQAKLGKNVLDYYFRVKRMYRYLRRAAEQSLVLTVGYVKVIWEPSAGQPYGVEDVQGPNGEPSQRIAYEGDIDISTLAYCDVKSDPTQEDWNKNEWVRTRVAKNKFGLASRYPQFRDQIERLPSKSESGGVGDYGRASMDKTSDVWVYEFYHKRSDALPNGRYILYCANDVVLYDGPMQYDRLPVFRIVPDEMFGTTDGYTDSFDLLPIQEALNVRKSTAFTNQQAFGVQNVIMDEGTNISPDLISGGLRIFKKPPGSAPPAALQLTQSPKEMFESMKEDQADMESISGMNAAARGNPESQMGKDASGTAIQLVQQMAMQYNSGFQQSWAELNEDVASFILFLLKTFAKTERMIAVVGKRNKGNMMAFSGAKIDKIDRVICDLGNPMTRTIAGRLRVADNLLQSGKIRTGQQYLTVMETGQLDVMTQGPEAEADLIAKENELLQAGQQVHALVGDTHIAHMQEHRALIADPSLRIRAARNDPQATAVIQATLAHITEHTQLKKTEDPIWSIVSGEPPLPPNMLQQGPPGAPPPQGPPPGQAGPHPQGPGPGMVPPPQAPGMPSPPHPPAGAVPGAPAA